MPCNVVTNFGFIYLFIYLFIYQAKKRTLTTLVNFREFLKEKKKIKSHCNLKI